MACKQIHAQEQVVNGFHSCTSVPCLLRGRRYCPAWIIPDNQKCKDRQQIGEHSQNWPEQFVHMFLDSALIQPRHHQQLVVAKQCNPEHGGSAENCVVGSGEWSDLAFLHHSSWSNSWCASCLSCCSAGCDGSLCIIAVRS